MFDQVQQVSAILKLADFRDRTQHPDTFSANSESKVTVGPKRGIALFQR